MAVDYTTQQTIHKGESLPRRFASQIEAAAAE